MTAAEKIQEILDALPHEEARQEALRLVMKNRCRKCFDRDPGGWCCYNSRGG